MEHREAEAAMLDMGLWGSSVLPPLLLPKHFRDTLSGSQVSEAEERVSTTHTTSAAAPTAVIAVELHGDALGRARGDEEGNVSAVIDRHSCRSSRGGEESSGQPSPSSAPHTPNAPLPINEVEIPPPRPNPVMRLGSYHSLLPRPQLLQLYQVSVTPSWTQPLGYFLVLLPRRFLSMCSTAHCMYCPSQVLPPSLLSRGRTFGSQLTLGPDWHQLQAPYFDAPGECQRLPPNSLPRIARHLPLPPIKLNFPA